MRKKIALFLAAIMVVGTLPMTAFAQTTNKVTAVKTVENDKTFDTSLSLTSWDAGANLTTTQTIKLTLTNAKWQDTLTGEDVTYTRISDKVAYAEFVPNNFTDSNVVLPIQAKTNGEGEATVTIDGLESSVTSGTYKIANIAAGATTTTVDDTTKFTETATALEEPIVITETVAGSIEAGTLKLKLTNGFTWDASSITFGGVNTTGLTFGTAEVDAEELTVPVTGSTTKAATVVIDGLKVDYDEDDVEIGDVCYVTVSGAGVTKETIELGTVVDYGITMSVENKELPVVYSGDDYSKDDTETLKVKIHQNIDGSFIDNRKCTFTLPEGVKVDALNVTKGNASGITVDAKDASKLNITAAAFDGKKLEFKLEVSVSPEFTGDITGVLAGAAIGEDQEVVIATAKFPITIEADTNELKIDYRNTPASDIVITEAEAGILEKGKTVYLDLETSDMQFDGTPTVTVEEGDMKVKDVKVNGGTLQFTIKQASNKDAAVIRISDVELYMKRDIPAGKYDLSLVQGTNDAIFKNFDADADDADKDFDADEILVCEGYVTVVTAGRDQDDSTFTTAVEVTIGADTMKAGSQVISLDVPAYIANGYTMLPVRAVAEALSDAAIVKWDDATKTVTIFFGQRVISMTIGSKVMVVNGVEVGMSAAPEITNGRTFLPLRDLGYALGLGEDKITWDDATKTAKLN